MNTNWSTSHKGLHQQTHKTQYLYVILYMAPPPISYHMLLYDNIQLYYMLLWIYTYIYIYIYIYREREMHNIIVYHIMINIMDIICHPLPKSNNSLLMKEWPHLKTCTPNLPTNFVPTNIAWLKLSAKSPMDMRISTLTIKITLESNPQKSTMLVGGLAVIIQVVALEAWHQTHSNKPSPSVISIMVCKK